MCPAIAWKKKAYRSKFDHEKNYVEFTQLTTRMLNAHTVPLACELQEEILKWLRMSMRSGHIAGSRNIGYASAGYRGTNSAQGIESRWRYLKRDACGGSSGTKSLPLKVFVPALLTRRIVWPCLKWKRRSNLCCCNTRCLPTRTWTTILMKIQGQDRSTCWMSWKTSNVSHHLDGACAGFHSPAPGDFIQSR